MVEPAEAATPQGVGQPPARAAAPAVTGQPAAPGEAQPQYVTLEQVQQMLEDNFRRAQSLYSKGQAGFEKKIQADLKNLEKALDLQRKAGITVSPEQENQLKQQVINQAFTEPEQPIQPELPGQQPAQAAEWEEPDNEVTAIAWEMMDKAGVDVLTDDPEYKQHLAKYDDPNYEGDEIDYLQDVKAAIKAKQIRLSAQPQPAAPARLPTNQGGAGSGPSNLITGPINLDDLWKKVEQSGGI